MDRKRSLAIGVVMALAVALAACGSGAPAQTGAAPAQSGPDTKVGPIPQTLKATLLDVNESSDDELNFADSAKNLSAGAIAITQAPNWRSAEVSTEADLVNDVAAGKGELGIIAARGFDTAGVDSFMGLHAPMLIDSYDLEAKVLATDWATKLLDEPRSVGIVGLGYIQGELRGALGITRDLGQVSDFKGAVMGIQPSRVSALTMTALGATTSLQTASWNLTGLDGIEMGAPGISGNDFYTGAKSITGNLVFEPRMNIIFANAKWFDSLSAEQQGQLRAAVAESNRLAVIRLQDNERESRGEFCAHGFTIKEASAQAIAALRQRVQPVYDELIKDPGTKATIDAITALRGTTVPPDVIAPCTAAASNPSPLTGPTALDGTWKMSDTKDELASSPFLDDMGSLNDSNWGDWTMTFANGVSTYTQTNPIESSSGSATFTVEGDTVTLTGTVVATFEYRCSIYKDTLTFKRDPTLPFAAPTPILVKPWTRVH
jgi:TRAP-type C4-dicarboxylate transport system substrate-binding protein